MILGCGGAGKSTLAKALHEITGLPLIHLDQLYWKPNWEETEKQEWEAIVEAASDKKQWIMDGNYSSTMDFRLRKADTIIFLDRSRWLCLYRVMKRIFIHYGKTRPDMAEDCNERFKWDFVHYVLRYNQTRRPKILKKISALKTSKQVFILRNEHEVNTYLKHLTANR